MSVKSLFQACAGVAVALMGARLPAATRVVDKFHGPYYTIQAAVEAAEAGETVFVRNGIHDVGGALDGFSTPMSNRVYLAKSLTIVGESRDGTIVKGAHATEVDDKGLGCGANAVRCLGINADNVVVSNLTFTGGATHNTTAGNDKEENNGGGVYVVNFRRVTWRTGGRASFWWTASSPTTSPGEQARSVTETTVRSTTGTAFSCAHGYMTTRRLNVTPPYGAASPHIASSRAITAARR